MKNSPRSALIIGGTGFIGVNVCKRLVKKNLKVFSISTKLPEKKKIINGVTYLEFSYCLYSTCGMESSE